MQRVLTVPSQPASEGKLHRLRVLTQTPCLSLTSLLHTQQSLTIQLFKCKSVREESKTQHSQALRLRQGHGQAWSPNILASRSPSHSIVHPSTWLKSWPFKASPQLLLTLIPSFLLHDKNWVFDLFQRAKDSGWPMEPRGNFSVLEWEQSKSLLLSAVCLFQHTFAVLRKMWTYSHPPGT